MKRLLYFHFNLCILVGFYSPSVSTTSQNLRESISCRKKRDKQIEQASSSKTCIFGVSRLGDAREHISSLSEAGVLAYQHTNFNRK